MCALHVVLGGAVRLEHAATSPVVSGTHAAFVTSGAPLEPRRTGLLWRWGAVPTLLVVAALAASRVRARARRVPLAIRPWRSNANRRGPPHLATLI